MPDGGYDENEDCINAEDESYREALEVMEKEVRFKKSFLFLIDYIYNIIVIIIGRCIMEDAFFYFFKVSL